MLILTLQLTMCSPVGLRKKAKNRVPLFIPCIFSNLVICWFTLYYKSFHSSVGATKHAWLLQSGVFFILSHTPQRVFGWKIFYQTILASYDYFFFFEAHFPPINPQPPLPITNPKAYQTPLLFGANRVMSSLKSISTRSTGTMIPCRRPCQNPKVCPFRHPVTTSLLAQPDSKSNVADKRRTNTNPFIVFKFFISADFDLKVMNIPEDCGNCNSFF